MGHKFLLVWRLGDSTKNKGFCTGGGEGGGVDGSP